MPEFAPVTMQILPCILVFDVGMIMPFHMLIQGDCKIALDFMSQLRFESTQSLFLTTSFRAGAKRDWEVLDSKHKVAACSF